MYASIHYRSWKHAQRMFSQRPTRDYTANVIVIHTDTSANLYISLLKKPFRNPRGGVLSILMKAVRCETLSDFIWPGASSLAPELRTTIVKTRL